ncbi:MAG: PDDEXK nuclease domain-containing protein [Fibromonadales bacterium]|nr:PDDEXK nuclease domain-containing protein [Fibromonadales bacterium]
MTEVVNLSEYRNWLRDLKQQIKTGQIKAALSVNSQMIMLYWDLGRQIAEKQEKAKWGSGFIEQLSKDLRSEFPEMAGFSVTNLKYCRLFFKFYSSTWKQIAPISKTQIGEQAVHQFKLIPWGHHMLILKRIKNINQALFYINKTIENSWSRAVLEYQIETNLYARQGKAITNFSHTLPEPQSDLANEIMKDPYNFDFLRLSEKAKETDIEKALVQHISQFLPELGIGFAYMGRQFSLKDINNPIGVSAFRHTELADEVKAALPSAEALQNELLNFEREHGSLAKSGRDFL